jgi:hypothetical protein
VAKKVFREQPVKPQPRLSRKWIIAIAAGLVIVVSGGILALFTLVKGETPGPKHTVLAFDRAFRTADCDLYESVTTPELRDNLEGSYSCAEWTDYAKSFQVDGESFYKVEILEVTVDGNSADVKTIESDSSQSTDKFAFLYRLTLTDAGWIVTNVVQGPAVS